MTDKVQKILSEIATRKLCTMDEHMAFYNDTAKEDYRFLSEIEELIKALQEEPVSNELEKVVEEIVDPTILNAYGTKELARRLRNTICGTSVSEDLSTAAKEYANNITEKIGYRLQLRRAVVYGAKWQKEQMMEKGVDGVVHHFEKCGVASVHYKDPAGVPMAYYFTSSEELSAGDKVKVIVIKED